MAVDPGRFVEFISIFIYIFAISDEKDHFNAVALLDLNLWTISFPYYVRSSLSSRVRAHPFHARAIKE